MGEAGAQALVLADEPATSCYLPAHRAFLRWLAASSEADLAAAAGRVLADPATGWEGCGPWTTDGPAVLMDSTTAGTELGVAYPGGGLPDQASVPLPAGTWQVRAVLRAASSARMAASQGRPSIYLQGRPQARGGQ